MIYVVHKDDVIFLVTESKIKAEEEQTKRCKIIWLSGANDTRVYITEKELQYE